MNRQNTTSADLGERIQRAWQHAVERGAVVPLRTHVKTIAQGDLHFVVKCITALSEKDKVTAAQSRERGNDPFLSYDPDLFVAELSDSHVLLLNKFPIEQAHTLAVTRSFVPQTSPLDATDFDAAATLLSKVDGLVAYNGCPVAGASQRHRHLHLLPDASAIPLLPLFSMQSGGDAIAQIRAFDFVHAFIRLDTGAREVPARALNLQHAYEEACRACGLVPIEGALPPYNLLATREWMLLVPRLHECWTSGGESVSLNAFSYAGVIAVRNPRQSELAEAAGLWAILGSISIPKP